MSSGSAHADLLEAVALSRLGRSREGDEAGVERLVNLANAPALLPPPEPDMRMRHHLLARCLCDGMQDIAASAATGYATTTIAALKKSPAFQELVEYYRSQAEVRLVDVYERKAMVGATALEEIQQRLDNPAIRAAMTLGELRELVKVTLGDKPAVAPQGEGGAAPPGVAVTVQFVAPPQAAQVRAQETLELRGDGKGSFT